MKTPGQIKTMPIQNQITCPRLTYRSHQTTALIADQSIQARPKQTRFARDKARNDGNIRVRPVQKDLKRASRFLRSFELVSLDLAAIAGLIFGKFAVQLVLYAVWSSVLVTTPVSAQIVFDRSDLQPATESLVHSETSHLNMLAELAERPACQEFTRYLQEEMNTTGLLVIKDGVAQIEMYGHGANQSTKTKVWSISKFFTGLLLGTQVSQWGIELLDTALEDIGMVRPDLSQDTIDSRYWELATIRDIWTMASGINWCEYGNCRSVDAAAITYGRHYQDAASYVLSQPLSHEPGTYYRYSAGNYVLLQSVLRKLQSSDQDYWDLPRSALLDKLNISEADFAMERDGQGTYLGGSGMSITIRALAKLGQLILNQGEWNGEALIPHEFYKEMTRNSFAIKNSPFSVQNWEGPAGGSVWLNDDSSDGTGGDRDGVPAFMPTSPRTMIYAGGNLGQMLLIYPSINLIVARTGGDASFSSKWTPVSEGALRCFSPQSLRPTVQPKAEKVAPDTGKNLSLFTVLHDGYLQRMRAQELCSCLFVSRYEDISTCDQVVPISQPLFADVKSSSLVGKPSIDWRAQRVTVTGPFGLTKAVAEIHPAGSRFGCRLRPHSWVWSR